LKQNKIKFITLAIIVAVLIVGVIVLTMSFGASDDNKVSDDVWLERFKNASTIDTEQKSFTMESNTLQYFDEILDSKIYQTYKWDLDSNEPYVQTETISNTLLDKNDPKYMSVKNIWKNGVMTTTIKSNGYESTTETTRPIEDIFRQINIGLGIFKNAFLKENFSEYKITGSQRELEASIKDEKIGDILGHYEESSFKNMKLGGKLDSNLNLQTFNREYQGEDDGIIIKHVSEVNFTQSSTKYA